jgi:predicted dehydrogenase
MTDFTSIGAAVIGTGFIGTVHLWALRRLGVRVEGVLGSSAARGAERAATLAVGRAYASLDELIADPNIDVVHVTSPNHAHFPQVKALLAGGKHVVCEKPLAASLAEVDALIAAAEANRRQVMPVFQYRFGNGFRKLQHLLAAGVAGTPLVTAVETHWNRGPAYYQVPWRGRLATELGGMVMGHAIHAHDLLAQIHGAPRRVFARTAIRVNPIETEDCAAVLLEMADGVLVSHSMTLGAAQEVSRLRFCFTHLTAESCHDRPYQPQCEPWRWLVRDEAARSAIEAALADFRPGPEGFAAQFAGFHEALEGRGALPVSLADGRDAIELATAIYASAASGSDVTLPIAPDHPLYQGWADAA